MRQGATDKSGATRTSANVQPVAGNSIWIVVALSCGAFATNLDLVGAMVALPSIGASFGQADIGALGWVLSGYSAAFATTLLPAGQLADRFGRRRLFAIGATIFASAAITSAAAPSLDFLVAARIAQGIGAGILVPASLGLLLQVTPSKRRSYSVAIWAATSSLAFAIGPVVGGLLASTDWRLVFALNLPFITACWWVIATRVSESDTCSTSRIHLRSNAALALIVGSVVLLASEAPHLNLSELLALTTIATAIAGTLLLFTRSAAAHPSRLGALVILRAGKSVLANLCSLLLAIEMSALTLSAVLLTQGAWSDPIWLAGFEISIGPVAAAIASLAISRMAVDASAIRIGFASSILIALAAVWLSARAGAGGGFWAFMLPGMVVGGVGVGLGLFATSSLATRDHSDDAATAVGLLTTSRQLGTALGVAGVAAIIAGSNGSIVALAGPNLIDRLETVWVATALLSLVTSAIWAAFAARVRLTRPRVAIPVRSADSAEYVR